MEKAFCRNAFGPLACQTRAGGSHNFLRRALTTIRVGKGAAAWPFSVLQLHCLARKADLWVSAVCGLPHRWVLPIDAKSRLPVAQDIYSNSHSG
jgi:hypothetical protein